MKIFGIDPGLANCGWSYYNADEDVVKGLGCIKTKKIAKLHANDLQIRTEQVCRQLRGLVTEAQPTLIAIEAPHFFGGRARDMGVVWGTLIDEFRDHMILHVSAKDVRNYVLGKTTGVVKKEQFHRVLLPRYGLTRKQIGAGSEHALDALGIAVTAANIVKP